MLRSLMPHNSKRILVCSNATNAIVHLTTIIRRCYLQSEYAGEKIRHALDHLHLIMQRASLSSARIIVEQCLWTICRYASLWISSCFSFFFSSVSLVQDVAQEHMRNMRSCLIELCKQLEWLRSLCSDLLHFVRVNEQLLREMELLGLSQLQAVQDQRRDLYESFHIRCDSLTLSTLTSFLI